HQCIVQGDALYASIAAASVLAKTYRDDHMKRLHDEFPQYNWASNKGYATRDHQEALNQHGPCVHHRRSFRLDYTKPVEALVVPEQEAIVAPEPLALPAQELFLPAQDVLLPLPDSAPILP
ncbi:MAG: hypothetical protein EOP50_12170, partial [Sphingobacteriales bacterium]